MRSKIVFGLLAASLLGLTVVGAQTRFYYFNGIGYTFPSAQGAAGTVLTNNGTGTLTWASPVSSEGLWSGSVILSTSACPSGYTRLTAADDRMLRAAATAGGTGGANTHTHTMSGTSAGQAVTITGNTAGNTVAVTGSTASATANHSHTNTPTSTGCAAGATTALSSVAVDAGNAAHTHGAGTLAGASHTHGVGTLAGASHTHGAGSLTTSSGSSVPAYYQVIACRKD